MGTPPEKRVVYWLSLGARLFVASWRKRKEKICRKLCPPSYLLVVPSQWAKTTLTAPTTAKNHPRSHRYQNI